MMAYSIVRVQLAGFRSKFRDQESDTDFQVAAYTALDDYLCTMEQRGWNVVNTQIGADGVYIYLTLHQADPAT